MWMGGFGGFSPRVYLSGPTFIILAEISLERGAPPLKIYPAPPPLLETGLAPLYYLAPPLIREYWDNTVEMGYRY